MQILREVAARNLRLNSTKETTKLYPTHQDRQKGWRRLLGMGKNCLKQSFEATIEN